MCKKTCRDLEDKPCPLGCGLILTRCDRMNNLPGGEFAVVRCRGCGLLRTNPLSFFYKNRDVARDYGKTGRVVAEKYYSKKIISKRLADIFKGFIKT